VHWPDGASADGHAVPWAGECWAIEAELTSKTVTKTTAIMRELLSRTGDYGGPAAQARVPGQPVRHTRVLYVCSARARPNVLRGRAALGPAGGRGGGRAGGGRVIAAAARRVIPAAVVIAVLVAAAPISLVAAGAVVAAWLCGWPPRRGVRAGPAGLPPAA